jgi:hypothetical protein
MSLGHSLISSNEQLALVIEAAEADDCPSSTNWAGSPRS